jgi:hypothetical protein
LVVGLRVIALRCAAPVLEEGNATEAGFGISLILAPLLLAPLILAATWTFSRALAVLTLALAVLALAVTDWATLALLGWIGLAVLAAIAPTLVVALDEATHRLDDAEVVVGVLPVRLRHDPVSRRRRFARQRLVLVEDLMRVAANPHVRSAAVEDLVTIGRTVGIVMLLVVVATAATAAAATIAAAARPLPIVWSH